MEAEAPLASKELRTVRFGRPKGYEGHVERPLHPEREILDPYAWLRCDTRDDPKVLEHLMKENLHAESMTKHLETFREELYREMLDHVQETDETCPYPHGDYLYYVKTQQGKSYKVHCRRSKARSSEEESVQVLLDVNLISKDLDYCDVPGIKPSPCHRMIVYAIDTKGNEDYDLIVLDASTGEEKDRILRTGGCYEWDQGSEYLYYTKRDKAQRQFQIWRHEVGGRAVEDVLLLQEDDELFNLVVHKTLSGRFIVADSSSTETSEVRLLDLEVSGAKGELVLVQERTPGLLYSVSHRGGCLYIETNLGKEAQNFTLLVCSIEQTSLKHWKPLDGFEYNPERYLTHTMCFKDHVAVFGRQDGFTKLWILAMNESEYAVTSVCEVQFDECPITIAPGINKEFDSTMIRLEYESMVTPESVLDYDMTNGDKNLKKVKHVPKYDRSLYASERLVFTARDGTSVPISIVYRKDKHEIGRPEHLMLYGYGSYGICIDPFFSPSNLVLLDRGVHFAVAHIRGGGEMGRAWYEDQGKYLTKKNTFYDFIDAADYLVAHRWTSPDMMAIHGRSAGGLLMGAVLNMRPDICKVCLAGVPFVDLMCTMSDPSIPLTVPEWEEWGNPHDERYFDYMLSYSPIDNVTAQAYPSIIIAAGLHDPRVAYWEPAKWAAKLRDLKTDSNPIILKTEMSAGHFSASDRYKHLKEKAFEYAFVLDQLGLSQS